MNKQSAITFPAPTSWGRIEGMLIDGLVFKVVTPLWFWDVPPRGPVIRNGDIWVYEITFS